MRNLIFPMKENHQGFRVPSGKMHRGDRTYAVRAAQFPKATEKS